MIKDDNNLLKIAAFPGRYIQGPGALNILGDVLSPYGNTVLTIAGEQALKGTQKAITVALANRDIKMEILTGRQASEEFLSSVIHRIRALKPGAVLGVGGGQMIDVAKAAANETGTVFLSIPTIASTDAPTSTVAVLYHEDGTFSRYIKCLHNPACVVVDTAVLSKAPVRYLLAGMGGALGIRYEAEAVYRAGKRNPIGGYPFDCVIHWARLAGIAIKKYGLLAREANAAGLLTPDLESIIEANLLLSGIGFESGGLAAAHGVYHGIRGLGKQLNILHGEAVAFGVIVQLILEQRGEKELLELLRLYKSLGLPGTLTQLGLSRDRDLIENIAHKACAIGTVGNMPFAISPSMLVNAILFAHDLGSRSFDQDTPYN